MVRSVFIAVRNMWYTLEKNIGTHITALEHSLTKIPLRSRSFSHLKNEYVYTASLLKYIITNKMIRGATVAGNTYFRQVVAEQLNDFKYYQSQKNRHGMSLVVQRIVQKVHDTGGRFMDQNWRGMVRIH